MKRLILAALIAVVFTQTLDAQIFRRSRNRTVVVERNVRPATVCAGGVCSPAYFYATPTYYTQPTVQTVNYAPKPVVRRTYVPAPVVQQTYVPVQRSAEPDLTPEIVESRVREELRGGPGFRRGIINAIRSARKSGKITPKEAVRIRVAMMSPAFCREAQTMAMAQMSFSGAEGLPVDENGNIDEAAIDWEGFAAFLERILPLILDLLKSFGLGG